MNAGMAVAVYSLCLTGFLGLSGAITFEAGPPQTSNALLIAAGCAALSGIVTSLFVARAQAVQAKARADYVRQYGEDPFKDRP